MRVGCFVCLFICSFCVINVYAFNCLSESLSINLCVCPFENLPICLFSLRSICSPPPYICPPSPFLLISPTLSLPSFIHHPENQAKARTKTTKSDTVLTYERPASEEFRSNNHTLRPNGRCVRDSYD